jgi:3-oxoacyl-[acyl-carrier protein] reductase
MLMSVIEQARSRTCYPELAGKRVLITGLSRAAGVDIARAFADHRTRLILQCEEMSEQMQALAEIVAPAALETRIFGPIGSHADNVIAFARAAAQAFGGLEVVVNLVSLSAWNLGEPTSVCDIEQRVAARLLLPSLLSNVAANRMRVTRTEGLILNVALLAAPSTAVGRAFASLTKTALLAMTRSQAEEWAQHAIRFNTIAPPTVCVSEAERLAHEPDVAALALYLASGLGKGFSGLVFEAEAL